MDLINYEFPIVNVSCLDENVVNKMNDLLKNKKIKFTNYESLIMDELVEKFKNLSINGKKYLDKEDTQQRGRSRTRSNRRRRRRETSAVKIKKTK